MIRAPREVLIYAPAAGAAFALDVGLLWALVNLAGWHYLLAASTSFAAGTALLYVLATRFVFRYRRIDSPALEFSSFMAIGIAGLLLNALLMWLAVGQLALPLIPAKVGVAGVTFFANFLLRRALLFTPRAAAALRFEHKGSLNS